MNDEEIESILNSFIKSLKIIDDDNNYKLGIKLESIASAKRDSDNRTFFYIYTKKSKKKSKKIVATPIDGKARSQSITTGLKHCLENNDTEYSELSNPANIYGKAIIKHIIEEFLNNKIIIYPDDIEEENLFEGSKKQIIVNAYERNSQARKDCIEYYGTKCSICQFDFEKTYGDIGKSFIHVHHLTEISTIAENYQINPIKDLRPVCPNCHAMLHKRKPAYTIEEIQNRLKENEVLLSILSD